ncbi:unknown [Acetobacter sp. CAG:267]|nr:unknown [Acetobacter sp. CAG:267]
MNNNIQTYSSNTQPIENKHFSSCRNFTTLKICEYLFRFTRNLFIIKEIKNDKPCNY